MMGLRILLEEEHPPALLGTQLVQQALQALHAQMTKIKAMPSQYQHGEGIDIPMTSDDFGDKPPAENENA